MAVIVPSNAKEMKISMVVLRADGTVKEDRGVVCQWHRNPLIRIYREAILRVRRLGRW